MHKEEDSSNTPGFSPDDPNDGREVGEWDTRYPDSKSKNAIIGEAIYLGSVLAISIISIILIIYSDFTDQPTLKIVFGGLSGGILGGSLFSIKWLYHSVAKCIWNIDRRLWRVFTPWISGGLSLAFLLLIESNLISIFDSRSLDTNSTCIGLGFLIGYFSDNAIAKLSELASTLFGTTKMKKPKIGRDDK